VIELLNSQWYTVPTEGEDADKRLMQSLTAYVDGIENSPAETLRRNNMIFDLELYYGTRLGSLWDASLGKYDQQNWRPENLTYNVIFGLVGTVRNRICSFRPRANFIPSNGDFKLFRYSKDTRAACDAWMRRENIYAERSFMFRDILTSPLGFMKAYSDGVKKVEARRFPPWELLVDQQDGRYRDPQVMTHARWVPLEQALADYGDGDDAKMMLIRAGATSDVTAINYGTNGQAMVRVVDTYKRGDHGRHVLMAGRHIALDEKWKHDGHPFIVKRFDEQPTGYDGVSGINSVRGVQLAINEETESMDDAHHMSSQQVLLVQENDEPLQTSNATTRVYKYRNAKPDVVNPPAVGQERYQWVKQLRDIAYEVWGVSQFLASGMPQPNLDSRVAIREAGDTQNDRIALLAQINEEIITETADWFRRLSEELPPQSYQVQDRGIMRVVEMPKMGDNVLVETLPSSLFGQSVAGRIDKAIELADKGVIPVEDALRAIQIPDLDPIMNLRLAEVNLREQIVDDVLEENKLRMPPEYMDPAGMATYAKNRYFHALTSGVKFPQANLETLCKLIDAELDRAKKKAEASAPQQQALPAPAQPGMGAAPPTGAEPPPMAPGAPPAAAPPTLQ
jgi:hypothetical protein